MEIQFMRSRILVGPMAALLLAFVVSPASANRLRPSSQVFDLTFSDFTIEALGAVIRCNLTLIGSFESSTIVKSRARKGAITNAGLSNCTGGTARILTETLPWNLQYDSFGGTLPDINRVSLETVGAAMAFDPSGLLPPCLIGTTSIFPWEGDLFIASSLVTLFTFTGLAGIPMDGGFLCTLGGSALFSGEAEVTNTSGGGLGLYLIG